jgi:hypothetical protein
VTVLALTRAEWRRGRDLAFALCVHTVALAVYVAIDVGLAVESDWDPLVPNSAGSTVAIAVAGWLYLAGGLIWVLGLVGVITWWLQRRQELVRRTVMLDSLLWLGPWLLLFLPWERTRRIVVPPRSTATVGLTNALAG